MSDQQLAELRGLLEARLAEIDENVTSLKEESLEVAEDQGDEAGFVAEDGSSLAEAGVVLAETVWVHVGVDLQLDDLSGDFRFGGLDSAVLAHLDATLDEVAVAALSPTP